MAQGSFSQHSSKLNCVACIEGSDDLEMEWKELELRRMLQGRGVVGQTHTEEHRLVQDWLKAALNAGKGNFLNDNAFAFL